jgi:heavy metal sensor kinase
MTLTTRLSLFFLGALAVVLLGFSLALYWLAYRHLHQQVDARLVAALDTLAAAVDHEPDGLDWDIHEKHLLLGQETAADVVRWEVRDADGRVMDRSGNLAQAGAALVEAGAADLSGNDSAIIYQGGHDWQYHRRVIHARSLADPNGVVGPARHDKLIIVAALSLEPTEGTLRWLGIVLVSLCGAVWVGAALTGRWLCRGALAPLTRMAAVAQNMEATDLGQRLPDPGTADELGELHLAFNGLLDRLQEAFERQRRFAGDASHQLRTPLTAMLGQVEVALRRPRQPQEYHQTLQLVKDEANHLRQIVEALLFLARADADAGLARLELVDLPAWVTEHMALWKQHRRAGDLRLEVCHNAMVRGQPLLLGQLLNNLLDNACKYTDAGTSIRVAVECEGSEVTMSVEDEGPGIAEADLPHVFEPFYRSATARRQGKSGVGLGLAMASRIATAFGGSLTVSSQPGHGCRFALHLQKQPAIIDSAGCPDTIEVANEC